MDEKKPHRMHGRSQEVHDALVACGIIHKDDFVRRVIIDIDVTRAVTLYVERFADSRMLDLLLPVIGNDHAEIRWADKTPETVAEAEQV